MTRSSSALRLIIAAIVVPASVRATMANSWSPACEEWLPWSPPEHFDRACDREAQNNPVTRDLRIAHWNSFAMPQIASLPEEKTWYCVDEDIVADDDQAVLGHSTKWVVHNHATTAVVLSVRQNGVEVSAADRKTSPPQANGEHWPNGAILFPGKHAVVQARQGEIFYARELKDMSAGRILLKHQVGLIHVKNEMGAECPQLDQPGSPPEAPPRHWTKQDPDPACNWVHKGFINKVGCEVDLFFAPAPVEDTNSTTDNMEGSSPQCEVFKQHLGVNPNPTHYLEDYTSPIVYEGVYNRHRFVARMSLNGALVQEITIDHDKIPDCPDRSSEQVGTKTGNAEPIQADVMDPLDVPSQENASDIALQPVLLSGDLYNGAINFTKTTSITSSRVGLWITGKTIA